MNNFKIIVFNNLFLFETLYELNPFLNLQLNDHIKELDNLNNFLEKNPKTLVLSSEVLPNKVNYIFIDKPFKILSLIDKIKITISKSKFKIQSNINIGKYRLDKNSRCLILKDAKLKLTEKEVDLLQYFQDSKTERTPEDLQKNIWKHAVELETHTVETHIYRLRKKISDKFNDDNFIINNKKGYKLEN